MAMDVNEADDRVRLASMRQDVIAKRLDLVNRRMKLWIWRQKLTIQIVA